MVEASKKKGIIIFVSIFLAVILAVGGLLLGLFLPKKTYTVFFHINDKVIEQQIKEGQIVSAPTDYTLAEGLEADKWYLDAEFTNEFSFDSKIEKNTHLYLKTKIHSISITFNSNLPEGTTASGFDFSRLETVAYGSTFTIPNLIPSNSDESYIFAGWSLNGETYQVGNSIVVKTLNSNIEFRAIWNKTEVEGRKTVTFNIKEAVNKNGESVVTTINKYEKGAQVTVPDFEIYHRYNSKIFVGFTIDGDNSGVIYIPGDVITDNLVKNISLTIVWQNSTNVLTLTFNNNEYATYNYLTGHEFSLPTPENTNQYNFLGWRDSENTFYAGGANYVMKAGETVLTAELEPANQTIHFDLNGLDATESDVVKRYGETFTLPVVTRDFYDFVGWSFNQNATSADDCLTADDTKMLDLDAKETTLYAIWSVKAYNVNFASDGSVLKTSSIEYNASFSSISATKAHHTLKGWIVNGTSVLFEQGKNTLTLNLNDETFTKSEIESDDGITLTAIWEANAVTITFNLKASNNLVAVCDETTLPQGYTYNQTNNTISTSVYKYGDEYTIPAFTISVPTDLSKEFESWSLGAVGENITLDSSVVNASEQVFAQISIKTTDTKLVLHNAESLTETEIHRVAGTKITLPTPTKTGYEFEYWTENPDVETSAKYIAGAKYTFVNGEQNLYAVYVKTYVINFDKNNSDITQNIQSITQKYGDVITLTPLNDTNKYSFVGWSPSSTAGADDADVIKTTDTLTVNFENNNVTLYAVWQRKTTTIKFDPNYGSEEIDETYNLTVNTFETYSATLGTHYSRNNYVITNWNTLANGTGTSYSASETVQIAVEGSEITLFAIWEAAPKQIIYAGNGGKTTDEKTQITTNASFGDTIEIPANTFVREGYRFVGWNSEADGSGDNFSVGDEFAVNFDESSVTVYAIWFNLNITIATADDIQLLKNYATDEAVLFTQTADVTVSDEVVINLLKANYNGGNYTITVGENAKFVVLDNQATISNLNVANAKEYANDAGNATAFTLINNGTIENVNLTTAEISTDANKFGALVMENATYGRIKGCAVNANVTTSGEWVGGVVGVNDGTITAGGEGNSTLTTFVGSITSTAADGGDYAEVRPAIGGIAAVNNGLIECAQTCTSESNTTALSGTCRVGGIAGESVGEISNSNNYATITCDNWAAGGIAGKTEGKIDSCNNYGSVVGNVEVGGINGVGGIAGQSIGSDSDSLSVIVNSFNYANLAYAQANQVAGIAGYVDKTTLSKCGNNGAIIANSQVGGIVGLVTGSTISECYNKAIIAADGEYAGGIGGQIGGWNSSENVEIWDCYNTGDVTGKDYVGGIGGKMERRSSTGGALYRAYDLGVTTATTGSNVGRILGYCDTYVRCVGAYVGQQFMGKVGTEGGATQNSDSWWNGVNASFYIRYDDDYPGYNSDNLTESVYSKFVSDIGLGINVWKQAEGSGLSIFIWE